MFRHRKRKIFVAVIILCLVLLNVLLGRFLNIFRERINLEMINYDYPNGRFGVSAIKLDDLVLEAGGTPMRNVIVSSWRSGSTFLGDMLNSLPGNYYHYEPLLTYGTGQIRGPPNDTQALLDIKKLLNCDYSDMDTFFDYVFKNPFFLPLNRRVWEGCSEHPKFCYHPRILGRICKLYPLQSMKLVRLRLKVAQQLLDDSRYENMF